MNRFCVAVCLIISLSGCGAYIVHPGALNVGESKAYDAVTDAKTLIDVARPQLASGTLSPKLKPAFDALVDAYNAAFPALKAYDTALRDGAPSDAKLAKLNATLTALQSALTAYKGVK